MKLKIATKLGLSFAVVLGLMILSGLLTCLKFLDIRQNVDRMTDIRVPSMEAARVLQDDFDYVANKSRQAILAGTDPARKAAAQVAFEEGWARLDKTLEPLARSPNAGPCSKIATGWQRLRKSCRKFVKPNKPR